MTRDEVLKEFYATPAVPGGSSDRMADEIVRLRSILDRLREPSDDVIDAASHAFTTAMTGDGDWYAGDQWGSIAKAIEAAVAAAEQEVANGHV